MEYSVRKTGRFLVTATLLLSLALVLPVTAEVGFQIYSTPSGAVVSVDNFWYDTTPATIRNVGSGWHTIQISMNGYQPYSQSQYCDDYSGGMQTCVIDVTLVPTPVSVGWLDINPFGAEVYVDGIDQGNGVMTIPFSPGNHNLVMKKPGYYDYSEMFTIYAGQTTSRAPGMTPYPQQPKYGSLQIDSDPAGASVYLDNAYKGVEPSYGPFYITDLSPGTYTLKLMMPDYQTYTEQVQVQAGIVNDIHAKLIPNPPGTTPDTTGQIYAFSVPGGANTFVDNAYWGITPLTIRDIPAGSHTVTFRQNGFQDYSTTANVAGGAVITVSGVLSMSQTPNPVNPLPTRAPLDSVMIIAALGITGIGIAARRAR